MTPYSELANENNKILNDDFEKGDYIILGPMHSPYAVAISRKTDQEFRNRVLAAAISYQIGIKSVDYIRRYYKHLFNDKPLRMPKHRIMLHEIINELSNEIESFLKNIKSAHENSPDIIGILAADVALYRCEATFQALFYLLMRGFSIEAIVLCRFILEQIAWAYEVHELKDLRKVEQIKPNKSMNNLKKLLPTTGRIYGFLSKFAHLSARMRNRYYNLIDGKPSVTMRDLKSSVDLIPWVVLVADAYILTSERIHLLHYTKAVTWISKGNQFVINPNRKLKKLFEKVKNLD